MRLPSASVAWLTTGVSTLLLACGSGGAPAASSQSTPSAGAGGATTTPVGGAGTAGSDATTTPAGSGGVTSTAGATSNAGSATAGAGGQTSAGVDATRPSVGCNKPSALEPGTFQKSTLQDRSTWLRLPTGYDAARAYPLIFIWKGCSALGLTSYGMETAAGKDAILVQGDFPPGTQCYDTADGSTFPDLPFFDALLAQVETDYCVDEAHVFSVGFSSGAWLTQLLACQRGDVLRGIGTIAGAFKPAFLNGAASCKGNGLSAFMVSDLSDHTNPFYDEDNDGDSVEIAVNHWLGANGCSEKTWTMTAGTPAPPDETVCRAYADCGRFPVELCLTDGKGHSAQETLSMPGFWQLFQQSLPK